jgi:hypothetical protein
MQKDRLTTAYERGILALEDFEVRLERINQDAAVIRSTLARLESQRDVTAALETRVMDQAYLLASLQEHLDTITTPTQQRAVIERLVVGIDVFTTGTGHHKTADLTVRFFFGEKHAALTSRLQPAVRR